MSIIYNWIEYNTSDTLSSTGGGLVSENVPNLNFGTFPNIVAANELTKVVGLKIQGENLNSVKIWLDQAHPIKWKGDNNFTWTSGSRTITLSLPVTSGLSAPAIGDTVYFIDGNTANTNTGAAIYNLVFRGKSVIESRTLTDGCVTSFVIQDVIPSLPASPSKTTVAFIPDSIVYVDIYAFNGQNYIRNNLFDADYGYKIEYDLQNGDTGVFPGSWADFPTDVVNAIDLGPITINKIGVGYSKKLKIRISKNAGVSIITNADYRNLRFLVEITNI